MRKNKLIGSVAAAMMLALALGGFSACDSDDGHVHEYTKWAHDDTQHWKVCEADGAESTHVDHFFNAEDDYKCECGAQHTHTYEWKHNAEYHWQECADGFKTRKTQHSFNDDGVCECGETIAVTTVQGVLKIYNNGVEETDYSGVTFALAESESGTPVSIKVTINENGAYSFKVPQSEKAYTLTISKDGYMGDSVAFTAANSELRSAKLVYIAYATTPGMEVWGDVDYSQLDKNVIRLNNDIQFIYSKKTYDKVAFSVMLQSDWNSAGKDGRQGVSFRFKNDDGYQGIASIQTEGEKHLQCDAQTDYYGWWGQQGVGLNGSLDIADGSSWTKFVDFDNRTDLREALNAGELKLTVLRDGSVLYVFLNDEYAGFQKYADKYADMECEVGFYYFDFAGSTMRDWQFEMIEDTAELEAKIPTGSLNASLKLVNKGTVTPLTDGQKVKIEGGSVSGEYTVTDGKIALPKMVAGTYKFTYGEDFSASITVAEDTEYTSDIELQYKRFDLFNGWDEAQHDFSHVNDENPTIGNNGKTLNVISRDTYNEVAVSFWIKKGNSTHTQDAQGIVIKFSNGSYMFTRCEKTSDGYKLQWMAEIWSLPIAKAQWQDYQQPMTEVQNTAFESEDGLELTVVRLGNVLTVYVNGEKISGGTVTLDESYASMTAQVGFFDYDSKENATWKYKIESDISAYNTTSETKLSEEKTVENLVNIIENGNAAALVQRLRQY